MSYMWSERLLASVSGAFVCDSHEGRVIFGADLDIAGRAMIMIMNDVRAFSSRAIGILVPERNMIFNGLMHIHAHMPRACTNHAVTRK